MDQKPTTTELERIVQSMIDSGESEENIAAVIREYQTQEQAQVDAQKPYTGPSTFWEGVNESMYPGGEAQAAAAQGGLGFLKGATLNLPGSIMSGLGSVGSAIMNPRETIESIPEIPGNISDALSGMWETTKQAGTDPFAFGEMTGEIMGQPAVTAGLVRGAPGATRIAGRPVRAVGNLMQTQTPISGMLPWRMEPRTLKNLERTIGKWIARGGQRMMGGPDFDPQNPWPRPPVREGEVVPDAAPWFSEGEIIPPSGIGGAPTRPGLYPAGMNPAASRIGLPPAPQSGMPPGPTVRELTTRIPEPPSSSGITHTGYPNMMTSRGGTLPATTQTQGIQPVPTYKPTPIPEGSMTGTKPMTTPPPTSAPNVTLKREFTTPENVDKIIKNGYRFVGIESNGSMKFQKVK